MTELGVHLAIQHLPKLKFLKCNTSLQVVAQMSRQGASAPSLHHPADESMARCLPLMNLEGLSSSSESPYMRGGLTAAIQFCPFVVEVALFHIDGILDEELRALLNLKNLRFLILEDMKSITFKEGLLPIMQKFGAKYLEEMRLVAMNEIDVSAIAKHCSNLRSLTLLNSRYVKHSLPQFSKCLHQLINLEHLEVGRRFWPVEAPMASDLSILLLSSPSLVLLEITEINELSDEVIERAAVLHGFPKLEKLMLEKCPNVSENSIDLLLNSNAPIKKIVLHSCHKVKPKESKRWSKMARDKNWELSITITDRPYVSL